VRFKGTLWLSVVFLGIALYYFLVDLPQEERQQEEKERAETILPFDIEKVDTLTVARKDSSYTLKRLGQDDWRLIAPLEDKADTQTAENLIYELNTGRFSLVVEEQPEDLAAFGLAEPPLSLTVKLTDGSERTLQVGDDHPMGKGLYVKTADRSRVLLSSLVRENLDKSLFDARDKTILPFNREDIAQVALRQGEHSFELRREKDVWTVIGEARSPGDTDAINHFLNSVRSAKVAEFVAETPASLAPYGLDKPATELRLEQEGGKQALSILLGGAAENQGFYGKTAERPNVVRVPRALHDTLSKSSIDFLDKTLLAFTEDEVLSLELKDSGSTVALKPETDDPKRWRILRPSPGAADASTVASLLADLKEARIREFIQFNMQTPAAFGLDAPARELSVHLTGDRNWKLQLGNPTADGQNIFARREGQPQVFVLGQDTVKKLFRSPHDLKDKKLLSFNREDVGRLVIESPEATFRLHKKGEAWVLKEPEHIEPLKEFLVKDIFWTLERLEYLATPAQRPTENTTGLGAPALNLTLYGKTGEEKLAGVTVGLPAKDSGGRYASVVGDPALYVIPDRFLDEIPHKLDKFKG